MSDNEGVSDAQLEALMNAARKKLDEAFHGQSVATCLAVLMVIMSEIIEQNALPGCLASSFDDVITRLENLKVHLLAEELT